MSDSIRLHPKHGVNPTMGVCLFCKEDDGTIGLLGWNKNREAPRRMVLSAEPCAKCKEGMAQGIALVEALDHPDAQAMQVGRNIWLTGNMIVVTEDWVRRCVQPEELRDQMLAKRKAYISPENLAQMLPKEGV